MKINYWSIFVFLFIAQFVFAQNDTLVGILRDAKNKAVKNYPVTLGRDYPIVVKTDKNGVFRIPDANLQDTLYITMKKEGKTILIPVKGYNYLTVNLLQGNYKADYRLEPDIELTKILSRERNKMISSAVMTKSEIEKTRCQDLLCVLRRMSGVMVQNGSIRIRGGSSINSSNEPLFVVNNIPMNDAGILSTIPIQDVEEISILKDATIYGARGANGAVVIKTAK